MNHGRLVQDLNFLSDMFKFITSLDFVFKQFYSTSRLLNFSNTIQKRKRFPLKNN